MAVSAAVSVASFSAVLAASFAAVATSSLVPATFLSLVRAAKGATAGGGGGTGAGQLSSTMADAAINDMLDNNDKLSKALSEAGQSLTDIDLLVPKSAKITGDFEFQATDGFKAGVAVGAAVQVVTISAGYSALYTSTSKNKIHLEVDFVSVNYPIP